jgi:integrase/recombinase XerD
MKRECFPPSGSFFDLALFQKQKELFLLEGKYRNLQPSTLQFYREHLLEFKRFLVIVNSALTPLSYPQLMEEMIGSLLERKLSMHTIQGRIRTCRRLYLFLYPELPWPRLMIPLLQDKVSSPAPIAADHLDSLLKQPDQNTFNGLRDYVILLVLLDTGIRGFELSSLKISDIDWDDQTFRISFGKGQRVRYVPFQQTCMESLRTYITLRGQTASDLQLWVTRRGTPLKRSAMLTMIRKRCRGIDLNGIRGSAHTFRHTMAKSFLLNGGSVFALQHILGHTTLDMTRRYVSLLDADLRIQHAKYSPIEYLVSCAAASSEGEGQYRWT